MPECSHCGRLLGDDEKVCPACAKPADDAAGRSVGLVGDTAGGAPDDLAYQLNADLSEDSLVAVARFKSAAEAGFFAHELSGTKQIPVALIAEEHFDAGSGRWSTRFVLSAPEAVAETAARELEQLIEQTDAEEAFEDAYSYSEEPKWLVTDETIGSEDAPERPRSPAEESTIHWAPIVLTLAAGSVFLWGVRQLTERPRHQPREVPAGWQQDDLWDQLSRRPGTWTQQIEGGSGRRELSFDREHGIAIIREDIDGDGVIDREIPVLRER